MREKYRKKKKHPPPSPPFPTMQTVSSFHPTNHRGKKNVLILLLSHTSVEWHIAEGESFTPIKHCATVRGPVRKILLGERVALNALARCSGIATK